MEIQRLNTKRLVGSFGLFRGVEVPESLTDDDLEDELPYLLMFYKYISGSGYNFEFQSDTIDNFVSNLKRSHKEQS